MSQLVAILLPFCSGTFYAVMLWLNVRCHVALLYFWHAVCCFRLKDFTQTVIVHCVGAHFLCGALSQWRLNPVKLL